MKPRRVLIVLAAVAAAVILILRIPGGDTHTLPVAVTPASTPAVAPAAAGAAQTVSGDAPTAASSPDDIDDDSIVQPDPIARLDAEGTAAAATRFARAWTWHTGPDAADWAQRLTALSTPTLAGKLRVIDPSVVPAATVTGRAQLTATPGGADARIATDAGTLQLTLVHQGRWLVDTLGWTPSR